MFYKTGIDITNDKQMFNFLKSHFTYSTMNSWNRMYSIANNVKLYNLNLSGDWSVALSLLEARGYEDINWMIDEWCREHEGYEVYSNGRSGGYLVLKETSHNGSVLPEFIEDCDTYEDYKEWCRDYAGSVKANRRELRDWTELVRDFDKLCDELREYVNDLSQTNFEKCEMDRIVEDFNDHYANDLEMLDFAELTCDEEGIVDLSEVMHMQCLTEAFMKIADRESVGYKLKFIGDSKAKLESVYK
jgi:hypothetical protein